MSDRVAESHKDRGEESRNRFRHIVPMDIFKLANIIIPTIIKIGAVAAVGTIARSGLKKLEIAKQIATTKAVKPVRPPAPIPAADST